MKKHLMRLHPEEFELVKNGRKKVEARIFDDKRKGMKGGTG